MPLPVTLSKAGRSINYIGKLSLLVILAGMTTAHASLLTFSQEDLENNRLATVRTILNDHNLKVGQRYRMTETGKKFQDYLISDIIHLSSRVHNGLIYTDVNPVHSRILGLEQSEETLKLRLNLNSTTPFINFGALENDRMSNTFYSVTIFLKETDILK